MLFEMMIGGKKGEGNIVIHIGLQASRHAGYPVIFIVPLLVYLFESAA